MELMPLIIFREELTPTKLFYTLMVGDGVEQQISLKLSKAVIKEAKEI